MKAQLEPKTFGHSAGAAGHSRAEAAGFSAALLSSTHLEERLKIRCREDDKSQLLKTNCMKTHLQSTLSGAFIIHKK